MLRLAVIYKAADQLQRKSIEAAERVGKQLGARIQRTARQSIRKPNKNNDPSPPGKPPRSQTKTLKSSILFAYDASEREIVIGPRLLPGRVGKDAPEALEKGGVSIQQIKRRRRRQRVAARPFMEPALQKRLPELPGLWKDAIKQG
ncbi:MAG TPA: hypothetical protein DDW52_10225 [Planctomycetaceae bacterium]|nr:hypothetical protein [Planctomycetaceae bacterium]